jgi:hypothetical protein
MTLTFQQQSRDSRVDTATQSHHDTLLLAHALIIGGKDNAALFWLSMHPLHLKRNINGDGCVNNQVCLIGKRRNAGDGAAQNQGVNIVRAFIGIDHLQVHQVASRPKLVADAIAAHHVARHASYIQGLTARIAFQYGRDFHRRRAFVFHATQTQTGLQAKCDLGLHIGHFFLNELIGGQRPAELLSV